MERTRTFIATFLTCALLVSCQSPTSAIFVHEIVSQDNDTYTYRATTGRNVTCLKCSPGTHLGAHCSPRDGSSTICHPCRRGTFTSQSNVLSECSRCLATCNDIEGRVTMKDCTPSADRKCGCKDGFHASASRDTCIQHTECSLGFGVVHAGNSTRDTVCQKCNIGKTYSDVISPTEPCKRVRRCGAAGVARPSLGQSNNVCVVPGTVNYGNETSINGSVRHNNQLNIASHDPNAPLPTGDENKGLDMTMFMVFFMSSFIGLLVLIGVVRAVRITWREWHVQNVGEVSAETGSFDNDPDSFIVEPDNKQLVSDGTHRASSGRGEEEPSPSTSTDIYSGGKLLGKSSAFY